MNGELRTKATSKQANWKPSGITPKFIELPVKEKQFSKFPSENEFQNRN
jgi:hypothetical protein